MKVVIAGGGTAGHVNPALAVAEALEGDEVVFIGTEAGVEAQLVPGAGLPLELIEVSGFDRSKPVSILGTGWRALKAARVARQTLTRLKPQVVVGMGGYVSLPVGIAARTLRIPVVIHEQNIVFGLANRILKRGARAVAVSFEETLAVAGARGVLTGNPISKEVTGADLASERKRAVETLQLDGKRRTLLVFGGSLGAQRVNEAAAGLAELWADRKDLQVIHIVGRAQELDRYRPDLPADARLIHRTVPYMDRLVEAYALADLALCRGGATTIAELCAVGLPAIVVPYPYHRDQQQLKHAQVLERAGAARVLPDSETTAERVAGIAEPLLMDRDKLIQMATASRSLGRHDAAQRLATVVRNAA